MPRPGRPYADPENHQHWQRFNGNVEPEVLDDNRSPLELLESSIVDQLADKVAGNFLEAKELIALLRTLLSYRKTALAAGALRDARKGRSLPGSPKVEDHIRVLLNAMPSEQRRQLLATGPMSDLVEEMDDAPAEL